ncbi:uncharacterized protein LOC128229261 isoform X2 [Mya arenaria]|uniref:uncharacterized protein LOC128229261 isoform X2 n=1 Tax=Mya arenaria TaxID=6604 RepID=UPI0022DFA0FE|nr:uncharacterized protein LOC128229261 isoform X2 [Mya arenaria]
MDTMDVRVILLTLTAVINTVLGQINNIGYPSERFSQAQLGSSFGSERGAQFGDQTTTQFRGPTDQQLRGQSGARFIGQAGAQFIGQADAQFRGQADAQFGSQTRSPSIGQSLDRGSSGRTSQGFIHQEQPRFPADTTVDFFNSNLQLDTIASRMDLGGGSSHGSGRRSPPRSIGGVRRVASGIQEDPSFIQRILGSTVAGRELRMGEMDLPRHGGAGIGERHADGLLDGWDGNPQTLMNQFNRGPSGPPTWSDPFNGRRIPQVPVGFNGNFASIRGFGRVPPVRPRRRW